MQCRGAPVVNTDLVDSTHQIPDALLWVTPLELLALNQLSHAIALPDAVTSSGDDLESLLIELSRARGQDEVISAVRSVARRLIGADGVTFVLRDGEFCHYVAEDAISPLWKGQRFPASTCISGWAMINRKTVVIEDIFADDRIPHAAYRPTFVRSLAMVPVRPEDPVAAIGAYWARRHEPPPNAVAALERIANGAAIALANVALIRELQSAREDAERSKDAIILAMGSLAEVRDNETGNHIFRTQHYVLALAEAARHLHPRELTDEAIRLVFKSAPLHDISKVGVPDRILLKPGPLTEKETAIMRTHPEMGRRAIEAARKHLGDSLFLRIAHDVTYTHHERWDGTGYPQGLAGEAIPLVGRLMAIADVYDALVSPRVYKQPIPHARAVATIVEGRGTHFDPALVDVFLTIADAFDAIHGRFVDA